MLVVPPDGIWRVPPPCTGGAACIVCIEATPKSTNAAIAATAGTFLGIRSPLESHGWASHLHTLRYHCFRCGYGGEVIVRRSSRSAREAWAFGPREERR